MGSVSADSGDPIYVDEASGNDANDGLTPQTTKLTIKNAIAKKMNHPPKRNSKKTLKFF